MHRIILTIISLLLFAMSYSQESEFLTVVNSNDELDLTDITLVTIPTQGPYMLVGNKIVSLEEDGETSSIILPEELYIEDMIWTGEDFAIRSRHEIYMLNNIETPAFLFEEEEFRIFPWDEKRIFIVYRDEAKDHVYWGSLKHNNKVKRMISFDEDVVYLAPAPDDATLIVTTENAYLFTKEECIKYMSFWSPVRTAVMTSKGLFFATDEEICVLTGVDSFILLFDGGCRQLLFDGIDLYILTEDYDLLKCNIDMLDF